MSDTATDCNSLNFSYSTEDSVLNDDAVDLQTKKSETESMKMSLETKNCRLKLELEKWNRQYERTLSEVKQMESDHSDHINQLITRIKDLEDQVQQYSERMKEISLLKMNLDLKNNEFKDFEAAYLELEQELVILSQQADHISERKVRYEDSLKSESEEWMHTENEKIQQELHLLHMQIQAEGRLQIFTTDAAQELLQEALHDILRTNDHITHLSKLVSLQQETICFLENHIDPDGEARLRAFFRQLRHQAAAARPDHGDPADASRDLADLLSASFDSGPSPPASRAGPFDSPARPGQAHARAAAVEPRLQRASFAANLSARLAALGPESASPPAGRRPNRPGPPWSTPWQA